MRRVLDFLRFDDMPVMARPNYAVELRHITLWGVFANLIDGSFSSIVVAKTFHAPLLVPVVWATPLLAHLLSLAWGVAIRGRPKVRTFVVLAIGATASAASIAFTPSDWQPWGGWLFAAQVGLARIFMSGLVTLRTSIWRANYPHSHRARIAGRIQTLNGLLLLGTGAGVSVLFDYHAEYYRIVYPAIAVVGALSLLPLRRLRIRGEPLELREFRRHLATQGAAPAAGAWAHFRQGLGEAAGILRRDRPFARYCSAQYMLGSSNLMVDPVLTIFVTQTLGMGYVGSYLLMEQIPTILSLLTISRWAPLFDRVGVLRFRFVNSAFWLASVILATAALCIWLVPLPGVAAVCIVVLAAGRMAAGIGRGGGAIAWNLGHLHFAGAHDSELYMGIHVALTGIRGILMPFVGTLAYQLLGPASLALGIALTTGGLLTFRRLARTEGGAAPGETVCASEIADLAPAGAEGS